LPTTLSAGAWGLQSLAGRHETDIYGDTVYVLYALTTVGAEGTNAVFSIQPDPDLLYWGGTIS
jgi:hypothetical protein